MSQEIKIKFKDSELLYAAGQRCRCGAGVAYPLDHTIALKIGAWVCSAVLRGEVKVAHDQTRAALTGGKPEGAHDWFPWAFFKIREETSINNHGGHSTRPPGTVARTVGRATCPKCSHTWESPPYSACGLSHHWYCGACPRCGHHAGTDHGWSSEASERIETRYHTVVIDVADAGP